MINITMKSQKLWVNEHETKDGNKFTTYAISLGKRSEDGTYINKSVRVRFKRDHDTSCIRSGDLIDVNDAFLTLDAYKDRNGNLNKEIAIQIMDFNLSGDENFAPNDAGNSKHSKEDVNDIFAELEDDIPF